MIRQCPRCGKWTGGPCESCFNCKGPLPPREPVRIEGWGPRLTKRADMAGYAEQARLKAWLAARPRDERQVLALHYADGLDVAEIAQVLDLGESYVAETLRLGKAEAQEVIAC